ncbi:microspherule protein 1 isoform X1 [Epargyreus clarus]|uniref:microspherule protein 1 isoform X1 n=1 Tax=Epargyreus clarus TaxID=520877 RepID=UPI003C2DFA6E
MDFPATPSNASDSNEYPGATSSNFDALQDNTKRRSSSRSIKRRRFDDELVEYSLGLPGASLGKGDKRIRTQSYTSQLPEVSIASPAATPTMPAQERRRTSSKVSAGVGRKSRRKGYLSHLSTKDLGRWKPSDDLALILGVQQTNDLRTVHRGIKFSCRFTVGEIQSRWYALLYNAEVSRVAIAAMRNLHPDLVAAVQQQALYSTAEENLLSTIPSATGARQRTARHQTQREPDTVPVHENVPTINATDGNLNKTVKSVQATQPGIEKFQELLDQNPHVFYQTRTAKSLMAHWQLMKHYQLLPDQAVLPLPKSQNDPVSTFSNMEDTVIDSELPDYKEDGVETEMERVDRMAKRNIRLLENALPRWQVLVQSVAGGGAELDRSTLAVLRGRLVRYLMRSREIAVGRSTRDHSIDVDLTLEGPTAKVSRKQATVRLRNSGDFFISSEGKRPIFVDGRPVLQGNKVKLNHNSVIDIAGLRLVFVINQDFVSAIRQEAVKMTIPV